MRSSLTVVLAVVGLSGPVRAQSTPPAASAPQRGDRIDDGGGYPDGIRQVFDPYHAGRRHEALAAYQRWLPLINYENRQCGLLTAKILMKEGGVIASEAVRHPLLPVHPAVRAGLIEVAQRLDPLVLRWAR
jgi:2-keto-3-deoxy-L-arabinonate dehydratase